MQPCQPHSLTQAQGRGGTVNPSIINAKDPKPDFKPNCRAVPSGRIPLPFAVPEELSLCCTVRALQKSHQERCRYLAPSSKKQLRVSLLRGRAHQRCLTRGFAASPGAGGCSGAGLSQDRHCSQEFYLAALHRQ